MHGHTGACCSKRIISWQSGEGKFTTICHCFSHSPLLCEIWQLISTTNLVYRLLVPSAVKSLHIGDKPIIKVEKILKGSLDWIPSPSPSVKIQIMGGKVFLRCKGKTLLGVVNKLLKTKSLCWHHPVMLCQYYLK